jgi:hypothetical protein
MPVATPEQIDRVLQSVEYPADRDAILAQARRRRAGQAVRAKLEQLPTRSYDSPAKARQQLERIEPTLKGSAKGARGRAHRAAGASNAQQATEQQQLPLPEPVRQAAETVRIRTGRLAGQAGSQLADQADQRRGTAAETLMSTAQSIRQAGKQLDEEGQPQPAQVITFAAEQLEAGASYLRRTEVRHMLSQVDGIARRQPWLVLGVGVAAGFVATRLLKSTDMQQVLSDQGGRSGQQGTSRSPSDAITLLESDHKALRQLLRRGASAEVARRKAVLAELKGTLQGHERMEEEVFYPALKENPATRQMVTENYAEHQVVDEVLGEIEATDPSDPQWSARFAAMRANLEHHAEEEETELFPLARKAFTRGELRELGTRMSEIKELASIAATA